MQPVPSRNRVATQLNPTVDRGVFNPAHVAWGFSKVVFFTREIRPTRKRDMINFSYLFELPAGEPQFCSPTDMFYSLDNIHIQWMTKSTPSMKPVSSSQCRSETNLQYLFRPSLSGRSRVRDSSEEGCRCQSEVIAIFFWEIFDAPVCEGIAPTKANQVTAHGDRISYGDNGVGEQHFALCSCPWTNTQAPHGILACEPIWTSYLTTAKPQKFPIKIAQGSRRRKS